MENKKTILVGIVASVMLSACSAKPYVGPYWRQEYFAKGPEGASELFRTGWHDGCASASSAGANELQRLSHRFEVQESLIENDEYYNGWNKAFKYCHRYLYQYYQKTFSN